MASVETIEPRRYGGWRRPVAAGLGSMSWLATGLFFTIVIVAVILTMAVGVIAAVVLLVVTLPLVWLLTSRDKHHRTRLARYSTRVAWWRARHAGSHLYRSGALGQTTWGSARLPGLLATSQLSEWRDALGRPFALVYVPASGVYSVVLSGVPEGASLVDEHQTDQWVAHFGAWLRELGEEAGLVGASVTIETAPDSGGRLRREVASRIDPDAPDLARSMLAEVVAAYPVGSATVRAYMTLSFSARVEADLPKRDREQVATELASRLPAICHGAQRAGGGPVRPVAAQELCEVIRTAYDPDAAQIIDNTYADGQVPELRWEDVGPTAAQASWDAYRHDSGTSCTWEMSDAPNGEVLSTGLARLLAPHAHIDRKRVTLLYRPMAAGTAASVAQADKNKADFRAKSMRTPTHRILREQMSAHRTAAEEAGGAGVVDMALLVTATVTDPDGLPQARATMRGLAGTAGIRLRVVAGSQDSAFAAALPIGLVLTRHLNIPDQIRNIA